MLRKGVWSIALLTCFLNSSIASGDDLTDLRTKFSQAQQLASQGQVLKAISIYQKLISAHPQLPEAYNNLAALYLQQKKTKKAKHILEQGLYAHKGYGVLYESLTSINVAMAREAYSKALQIDLKPSIINIASLPLMGNNTNSNKNTIVISKSEQPVVTKTTEVKKQSVVEKKASASVLASGAIKRTRPVIKSKPIKTTKSLEKVLQAWSSAWSAQAVDIYLSFYHQQYRPANGMSRKGWVQSRRLRLKKPSWIKINLSDFNVKKNTGKQAIVNFKQLYRSNTFTDESAKQMVLFYTDHGWQIFREKSL